MSSEIKLSAEQLEKFKLDWKSAKATTIAPVQPQSISFLSRENESPILFLESNGDIYIKGELVENDKEVVDGMRLFLSHWGVNVLKRENESLSKEVKELREYKIKYEELCK